MMTMVMLVSLERGSADVIDRFKEALRVTPEVMMGYYVAADTDFMLIVTAKSIEDYDQFTRRFLFANPSVKRFKTMVVMDQVKSGFGFPIDLNDPMFNDNAAVN